MAASSDYPGDWPAECAFVFYSGETVLFKCLNERGYMTAGQFEQVGNALFIPAFVKHADNCPSGFVGIIKIAKVFQLQFQLDGYWVPLQEPFHITMIGFVPEFLADDAHNFSIMDWGIQML
jgi:hypothetical protein